MVVVSVHCMDARMYVEVGVAEELRVGRKSEEGWRYVQLCVE